MTGGNKAASMAAQAVAERQRTEQVYSVYRTNSRTAERLQTAILKGVAAGANIYELFLKAVQCISLMTSDTMFAVQIEDDLKTIYGFALNEKPVFEMELSSAQERLNRLKSVESKSVDNDTLRRIQRAIKAHEALIEGLRARITEGESE